MKRLPPLIAVVDDEESMRRALQRLLRSAGFLVEIHSSGETFLQTVREQAPACVVLDLHMPGVSGFDVQEALLRDGLGIPVVVITGYDTPDSRARVAKYGAKAYLRKPVDAMDLLAAINAAIGSRGRGAEGKGSET